MEYKIHSGENLALGEHMYLDQTKNNLDFSGQVLYNIILNHRRKEISCECKYYRRMICLEHTEEKMIPMNTIGF